MGIFAGGFIFVFVVPLLHEGGGIAVNGFIATNPQKQKKKLHGSITITRSSIATTTLAMRSTQNPSADTTYAPDEETPNGTTNQLPLLKETQLLRPKKDFGFYQPSSRSDFESFGYGSNPTVFGQILRGELKTRFLVETKHMVAFEDIRPRAPFHGLVIPKTFVSSVFELQPTAQLQPGNDNNNNSHNNNSLSLLEEMSQTARALVRDNHPKAYENGDYLLCFHVPPFNSVDHLHLHVLAPASSMAWLYRYGKYNTGTTTIEMEQQGDENDNDDKVSNFSVRWCTSLNDVMARLDEGSPPTPYQRDDSWATILSETVSSIAAILVSLSKSKSDSDGGDDK
jgi:diadenosine tetraphosphate (Ap4A) HIT family hydrolase